jgi:excisionase family DNA binding protein
MSAPALAQLLTVRQVAELLAVKEGTIYLWLAQRRLPKTSLGRAVRIPLKAVEGLIEANTTPARGGR